MINIKRPQKQSKSLFENISDKFYGASIATFLFLIVSFGTYILIRSSSLYRPANTSATVAGVATVRTEQVSTTDLINEISKKSNYKYFFDALTRTGVFEGLKDKGPFTVLVPDDNAFKTLGENSLNQLFDDTEKLSQVVLNHIIPYKIQRSSFESLEQITSVNRNVIKISKNDYGTIFNNAKLMSSENNASNGIFYEIDAVIL
jgi:uncharacterized surface protein with fasciclin (FAS1) repeats